MFCDQKYFAILKIFCDQNFFAILILLQKKSISDHMLEGKLGKSKKSDALDKIV